MNHENILDEPLAALLELDLEYRLTVAIRMVGKDECSCSSYLIERREVLLPAILDEARQQKLDPADVFARFARRLHAKHEEKNAS